MILADAPQRISFGNTVTDTLGDLRIEFARAPACQRVIGRKIPELAMCNWLLIVTFKAL